MSKNNHWDSMFTNMGEAMKIPTSEGNKSIEEIFDTLNYSSYAANRGYGMTHEALVRIGIGNDSFKAKYEKECE